MADPGHQDPMGTPPFRPLPEPPTRQKSKRANVGIQAALKSARNELTSAQVFGIMNCGSVQTINALLNDTQPHLTNPFITCLICIHPYHSPNVEGNSEVPVITACGHIFGNTCIAAWLQPESNLTCPLCRFELRYKECNHPISPVSAFSPPPPPKITAEQVPDRCGICSLDALMEGKNIELDSERARREVFESDMMLLRETGDTEMTDEEFQQHAPELWAEIKVIEKLVAASEEKIKRMEEEVEEDMEAARLARRGWYM